MNVVHAGPLTAAELRRAVQQADPTALLVPPRILRRVIRQDRSVGGMRVPHRRLYLVERTRLPATATRDEMGLPGGAELPAEVLLLPLPDEGELARLPRGEVLLRYSRLLFHGAAHRAFAALKLDEPAVRERFEKIG